MKVFAYPLAVLTSLFKSGPNPFSLCAHYFTSARRNCSFASRTSKCLVCPGRQMTPWEPAVAFLHTLRPGTDQQMLLDHWRSSCSALWFLCIGCVSPHYPSPAWDLNGYLICTQFAQRASLTGWTCYCFIIGFIWIINIHLSINKIIGLALV